MVDFPRRQDRPKCADIYETQRDVLTGHYRMLVTPEVAAECGVIVPDFLCPERQEIANSSNLLFRKGHKSMLEYAIKTVNILSQYWMHICMFSHRASFTDYFQFSWKAWFARWYLDNCIDCDCEVKVEVNAGWGFGQCQLLSAVCHFLWNLGQTTPGNKQQETSHAFVSVSELFLFFSSGWLPSEMQRECTLRSLLKVW